MNEDRRAEDDVYNAVMKVIGTYYPELPMIIAHNIANGTTTEFSSRLLAVQEAGKET